jgi:DMSO/TMAO reductase YedYZ molybdopterin-dependent catalytic subunit
VNPMSAELSEGAIMNSRISNKQFKRMSRRELLKLTPVLALGAFAIPALQKPLLKAGLGFSDWASAKMFRTAHLAPTFADTELTPFNKFPINGYDVADPGVDFDKWNLAVAGAVQKPGDYTLAQIQTLPKFNQNTRHVCVEGWDVIGNFGGVRLSNFLKMIGADTTARFVSVECADDYYVTIPTKVGYKQAKYLTNLKVTNVLQRVGYWEDQGYAYFYGL